LDEPGDIGSTDLHQTDDLPTLPLLKMLSCFNPWGIAGSNAKFAAPCKLLNPPD